MKIEKWEKEFDETFIEVNSESIPDNIIVMIVTKKGLKNYIKKKITNRE